MGQRVTELAELALTLHSALQSALQSLHMRIHARVCSTCFTDRVTELARLYIGRAQSLQSLQSLLRLQSLQSSQSLQLLCIARYRALYRACTCAYMRVCAPLALRSASRGLQRSRVLTTPSQRRNATVA